MGNNNKGKKSVIGDSESDEEDPVRATLKAKIREMKNKQLQRLLDLVELINDPDDALRRLEELSATGVVKQDQMSQIDDALPQPAELVGTAYEAIPLKLAALTEAAFSSLDTASFYEALMREKQRTVGAWANLTRPAIPPGDAATLAG